MPLSLRRQALRIFQAALKAAEPSEAVLRHVQRDGDTLIAGRRRYRLKSFRNIYVIGAGKASARMAQAVEKLLGARITSGLVNIKDGHGARLRHIELNECGHPVPDRRGVRGSRRIAQICNAAGADDLILCLISGGASALLPLSATPVTLADKQKTTRLLLGCGATIQELNCVRKHISWLKGGRLARLAYPATVLTLILSDVVGDPLDSIGSGPTAPDRSTFAQARAILKKYKILGKVPASVRARLNSRSEETPKPGDPIFRNVQNLIVGSNRLAVDAAVEEARALGFGTILYETPLDGEARQAAHIHALIARDLRERSRPFARPACMISGGETTVTLRGKGKGGRNQEFALAAAIDIAGLRDVVILSAGTDGTDGPTDAAGAIADGTTLARAKAHGLDAPAFLAHNDSYRFFAALGDLIRTGPTGTNVADVQIVLVR